MKNKKDQKRNSGNFITCFFLTIIAAFLFFLSNPNFIFSKGIGFLAFFIYLPLFFVIQKSTFSNVWLFGGFYGVLSYSLYGYWLKNFHPLGLIIVCICYFFICALLFLLLKWVFKIFKKSSWIVMLLCICGYEYIKTTGFFGISYGVTAYTQWKNIYLIQICEIAGVFGLNLLVIFPSAWLFSFITKKIEKNRIQNNQDFEKKSHIAAYVNKEKLLALVSLRFTYALGIVWILLMVCSYAYGYIDLMKTEQHDSVTDAAFQNNESPWKNGIEEYSKNVKSLIHLTEDAQALSPDIDFVIWPETAVAPSIIYNYDYGTDVRRFMLVSQILHFIDENNAVFVIGNSHEVDLHQAERARYNSALVFESGKNVSPPKPEIYSKTKLVPFVEDFPWKYYFPTLYVWLLNGDIHMWERGDEYKVFDYRGLKFSTPICFEDTFSFVCRRMVLNGARCFMNLSNDSWSNSLACQNQHLAMAVFRSVENEVPSVRCTASGETCVINYNGIIENKAPEFCEAFLIGKVPVLSDSHKTLFTKTGDIAGIAEVLLALVILIIQSIHVIINKIIDK